MGWGGRGPRWHNEVAVGFRFCGVCGVRLLGAALGRMGFSASTTLILPQKSTGLGFYTLRGSQNQQIDGGLAVRQAPIVQIASIKQTFTNRAR